MKITTSGLRRVAVNQIEIHLNKGTPTARVYLATSPADQLTLREEWGIGKRLTDGHISTLKELREYLAPTDDGQPALATLHRIS